MTSYLALASLMLFAVVGSVDKHLHHVKYKLWLHPETEKEHLLHTWNGTLFVPQVTLLFALRSSGPALWLGCVLFLLNVGVNLLDITEETEARGRFGGISSFEAKLHWLLGGLKFSSTLLAVASRPAEAWSLGAQPLCEAPTDVPHLIGWVIALGAMLAVVEHVVLLFRGRAMRAVASSVGALSPK